MRIGDQWRAQTNRHVQSLVVQGTGHKFNCISIYKQWTTRKFLKMKYIGLILLKDV